MRRCSSGPRRRFQSAPPAREATAAGDRKGALARVVSIRASRAGRRLEYVTNRRTLAPLTVFQSAPPERGGDLNPSLASCSSISTSEKFQSAPPERGGDMKLWTRISFGRHPAVSIRASRAGRRLGHLHAQRWNTAAGDVSIRASRAGRRRAGVTHGRHFHQDLAKFLSAPPERGGDPCGRAPSTKRTFSCRSFNPRLPSGEATGGGPVRSECPPSEMFQSAPPEGEATRVRCRSRGPTGMEQVSIRASRAGRRPACTGAVRPPTLLVVFQSAPPERGGDWADGELVPVQDGGVSIRASRAGRRLDHVQDARPGAINVGFQIRASRAGRRRAAECFRRRGCLPEGVSIRASRAGRRQLIADSGVLVRVRCFKSAPPERGGDDAAFAAGYGGVRPGFNPRLPSGEATSA